MFKSFHVGLISLSFSQPKFTLYGNQISSPHPIAYLQNILNVYNTFYLQVFNTALYTYHAGVHDFTWPNCLSSMHV